MSLVYTVYLADDEGVVRCFGPGDDVPAWARKAITNPLAWGEEPEAEKPRVPADDGSDGPPPQGGPGSGRPAWAAYAAKHDVDVDSDWSRDDIIAALEKAGVAV